MKIKNSSGHVKIHANACAQQIYKEIIINVRFTLKIILSVSPPPPLRYLSHC